MDGRGGREVVEKRREKKEKKECMITYNLPHGLFGA